MAERAERLHRAQERGYEPRDVSVRGVVWVAVIFAVTIGASAAAIGALVWLFDLTGEQPVVSPLERAEVLPPEPRLDARPAQALVETRRRENRILRRYGWIDQEAGIARIPIDQAMEILAERGWPEEGEGARPEDEEAQR